MHATAGQADGGLSRLLVDQPSLMLITEVVGLYAKPAFC